MASRRLGAALLVALVTTGAIGLAVLSRYAPLGEGSTNGPGQELLGSVVDFEYVRESPRIFVVRPAEEGTFRFGTAIANDGRFAVELLELVPGTGDDAGPLRLAEAEVTASAHDYGFEGLRPLAGVRIEPGDERWIVFGVRKEACEPPGETARVVDEVTTVRFRYRYLRVFTGVQEIRLPAVVSQSCRDPNA